MSRFAVAAFAALLLIGIGACDMGGNGGESPTQPLPEFDTAEPNDQYYAAEQWNMRFIEMPDAWGVLTSSEISRRARVVYVAVLDSRIDMTHPDLRGNLVDGWDFVDNRPITAGSGAQAGGTAHGTHVAGIIAAVTDNDTGVAGVGWNRIRVIPIRVLDDNDSGSAWDLANGILYAAGLSNSSGSTPRRRADVINLSLGAENGDPLGKFFDEAVTRAADRSITLIASSGNDGSAPNGVIYPAAYPNVIAVGSVDRPSSDDGEPTRSEYSDYGMGLEFVAPGGRGTEPADDDPPEDWILSTVSGSGGPGYAWKSGTSMAAPHVSGVTALLYSVADGMTQNRVRSILRETAEAIESNESYPHPEFGYGLIHAGRAVRRALMEPYGPYERDPEVSLRSISSSTVTGASSTPSADLQAPGHLTAPPEPATYRPDRLIVSFDENWVASTPREERDARLAELAAEHAIVELTSTHRTYGVALLSGKQTADAARRSLIAEAEISNVWFDPVVSSQ